MRASIVAPCLPRARGLVLGYTLWPAMWASIVAPCLPRARGLALGYTLSPVCGLALSCVAYPGLADSPWATRCRPLCGLPLSRLAYPGLADSPWATHCRPYAGWHCRALLTQGSRTHPGLHAVARMRACVVAPCLPRACGLALGYTLSPAMRACVVAPCLPRLADSPWATPCRPLCGFHCRAVLTQGSRTRPGLHAFARYAGFHQLR
jgi:hypothetical protein